MALTNAEKQARYRERHLGVGGEKARVQLFLSNVIFSAPILKLEDCR